MENTILSLYIYVLWTYKKNRIYYKRSTPGFGGDTSLPELTNQQRSNVYHIPNSSQVSRLVFYKHSTLTSRTSSPHPQQEEQEQATKSPVGKKVGAPTGSRTRRTAAHSDPKQQ